MVLLHIAFNMWNARSNLSSRKLSWKVYHELSRAQGSTSFIIKAEFRLAALNVIREGEITSRRLPLSGPITASHPFTSREWIQSHHPRYNLAKNSGDAIVESR